MGGIIILANCEFHFIRKHENMVKHPSNDISNLFMLFRVMKGGRGGVIGNSWIE